MECFIIWCSYLNNLSIRDGHKIIQSMRDGHKIIQKMCDVINEWPLCCLKHVINGVEWSYDSVVAAILLP